MSCLEEWRRWIRPLVIIVYFVILVVALPLLIIDFQVNKMKIHLQAWFISGVFVFLTIPISVWGITQHLVHYTRPDLQRCIIRILWMVPIYAVNAWFALRFKGVAIYLDTMRECYEAYVIYNFMSFLLRYLTSEYPDLEFTLERKPQVKHLIPFCLLPTWPMGKKFILHAKHGVLQYTVVRPITTAIALICELTGKYSEGDFDFTKAWVYLVIINNISQVWALYCLVLFYKALREELNPISPVGKFLCVKTVVFMSFWQAVLIALLVKVGVIKESNTWGELYDVQDIANGLQDFCICIEMFIAAVAHYFSFSHKPYVDYAAGYSSWYRSFLSMWDISDVRQDVMDHVRHVGKTVTRPLRGDTGSISDDPAPPPNSEHTPLLRDASVSGDESLTQTPPVQITADEVQSAMFQDGHYTNASADDVVSINTNESDSEIFRQRSLTASMNNYAQFSDSYSEAAAGSTTALIEPRLAQETSSHGQGVGDCGISERVPDNLDGLSRQCGDENSFPPVTRQTADVIEGQDSLSKGLMSRSEAPC